MEASLTEEMAGKMLSPPSGAEPENWIVDSAGILLKSTFWRETCRERSGVG